MGPALAWALRRGARRVDLVLDDGAGVAARRAALFEPDLTVWQVRGRSMAPAVPDPHRAPVEPDPRALALVRDAARGDPALEVVVEHGVVTGEVLGLEVLRAVPGDGDPDEGAGAGGWRLEVGVGRHDREAFGIIHGDLPTTDAVAAVLDVVRSHRRAGAPGHPLNRLARERWLRRHLLDDPSRLAGWALEPVEPAEPRRSLRDAEPALAAGRDPEGRSVVVACSVGADLDLVPAAADARARVDPTAGLVLAVPARDVHPVTELLAASLRDAAEVLPVEGDWCV